MVYHTLKEEIIGILKAEGACTRQEIASKLKPIGRDILIMLIVEIIILIPLVIWFLYSR